MSIEKNFYKKNVEAWEKVSSQNPSLKIKKSIFPRVDLGAPEQTLQKLNGLISSLARAQIFYDQLSHDQETGKKKFDDEDITEAYNAQKELIESIIPEGYALKKITSPQASDYWRGDDPFLLFSLLSDENSNIKLDPSHPNPNIAKNWHTSLPYGTGEISELIDLPYVLSFGFKEPQNFKIYDSQISDIHNDVIKAAKGAINFSDIKELAMRFKRKPDGQNFDPIFYQLTKEGPN